MVSIKLGMSTLREEIFFIGDSTLFHWLTIYPFAFILSSVFIYSNSHSMRDTFNPFSIIFRTSNFCFDAFKRAYYSKVDTWLASVVKIILTYLTNYDVIRPILKTRPKPLSKQLGNMEPELDMFATDDKNCEDPFRKRYKSVFPRGQNRR